MPPVRNGMASGTEDLVPRHHPGRNDEVLLPPVRRGPESVLRAPLDASHLGRIHRHHDILALLKQFLHRSTSRASTGFIVLKIFVNDPLLARLILHHRRSASPSRAIDFHRLVEHRLVSSFKKI